MPKISKNELLSAATAVGLTEADNLTEAERKNLALMIGNFNTRMNGNLEKLRYFNDEVKAGRASRKTPPEIRSMNFSIGWAAKAVNMLAARVIPDGFSFSLSSDETDELMLALDAIMDENDFEMEVERAKSSVLTHGCGFWTVCPTEEEGGVPVVNFHDAMEASALWNYKRKRIKCGFVIDDVEQKRPGGDYIPTAIVMHTDDSIIEIERDEMGGWVSKRIANPMGRPLMQEMVFRPTNAQPFGRSRVTSTVRSITDMMILECQNLVAHSQSHSLPQKFLLGLTDEQYDAMVESKGEVYNTDILMSTRDDDGNVPTYGMLQAGGVTQHMDIIKNYAERMAAETMLPLAAFGVQGNGYSSSDALRASSDDLILEAESACSTFGKSIRQVAQMAMAIMGGTTINGLSKDARSVHVCWKDPSMPSVAALSDAMVKQASVVPEFGGTDVFWKKLGYNDAERRQIRSDVRSNTLTAAVNQWFKQEGAVNEEPA